MGKNPHNRILKYEPNEQHLSFAHIYIYIYIYNTNPHVLRNASKHKTLVISPTIVMVIDNYIGK